MRWGEQADQLRAVADKTGKVPTALKEEPDVYPDMQWIWDAFWMLHRSRQIGMSVGPIPLSEIESFIRLFEVREIEAFIAAIDALDRMYLQHTNEVARSKLKQPTGAKQRGRSKS